jgi:hypothetical protein
MASRTLLSILLAFIALPSDRAAGQEHPADEVTRQLFHQYVARQGKITTESVLAATHLVAERGRETGFWKEVLAELRRNNPNSEIGCVRVLGKMLATDAAARDTLRRQKETGEISAWIARVCLPAEVVTELIERGRKADRNRVDHYVIALARARTPEPRDFFKAIVTAPAARQNPFTEPAPAPRAGTTPPNTAPTPTGPAATAPVNFYHTESTRFHAAVGLAQLGDPAGIDWLIAHCDDTTGSVWHARPCGTPPGGSLHDCCLAALQQLSNDRTRTTKTEWQAWAKSLDVKSLRDRAVVLCDL